MHTGMKNLITAVIFGLIFPSVMFGTLISEGTDSTGSMSVPEPTAATASALREPEITVRILTADNIVVDMNLEDYVLCVVLKEMPTSFELEALKAQAVATRTYTFRRYLNGEKHQGATVCTDPACCQAFRTTTEYLSEGGTEEGLALATQAVKETSRQILCYNGEPIEATYFSSSGGMTEASVAVWGEDIPYLQATESPEDTEDQTQTVCLTRAELSLRLGQTINGAPDTWFQSFTYTEGEGIASVNLCGKTYTGTQLRSLLGLRSTVFEVSSGNDCVYITTKGYGHRVGMSQYGANAMAKIGSTYPEILAHYYNGAKLSNCNAYLS